jgi:hypothetical protein
VESRSDRSLVRQVRRHHVPFGLLFIDHNRSGAGPGAVSEAQRRAFGGNGFFFMFPPNEKAHREPDLSAIRCSRWLWSHFAL